MIRGTCFLLELLFCPFFLVSFSRDFRIKSKVPKKHTHHHNKEKSFDDLQSQYVLSETSEVGIIGLIVRLKTGWYLGKVGGWGGRWEWAVSTKENQGDRGTVVFTPGRYCLRLLKGVREVSILVYLSDHVPECVH